MTTRLDELVKSLLDYVKIVLNRADHYGAAYELDKYTQAQLDFISKGCLMVVGLVDKVENIKEGRSKN